jgi:hypothetical protein
MKVWQFCSTGRAVDCTVNSTSNSTYWTLYSPYFKGISSNIKQQVYIVTCCWPYIWIRIYWIPYPWDREIFNKTFQPRHSHVKMRSDNIKRFNSRSRHNYMKRIHECDTRTLNFPNSEYEKSLIVHLISLLRPTCRKLSDAVLN